MFTWPVCLFVAFEPVAAAVRTQRPPKRSSRERRLNGMRVLVFLSVCLVYFLLCRRLSLVFEWSFLIGFVGAIPFCRLQQRIQRDSRWSLLLMPLTTGLAFTAFYICGVLPLLIMY